MLWPAQPNLQRDICVPGGAISTVRGHPAGVGVQSAEQLEEKRAGWLGRTGPQQHHRGTRGALDPDERVRGTAGLPVAHPPQFLGVQGNNAMRFVVT